VVICSQISCRLIEGREVWSGSLKLPYCGPEAPHPFVRHLKMQHVIRTLLVDTSLIEQVRTHKRKNSPVLGISVLAHQWALATKSQNPFELYDAFDKENATAEYWRKWAMISFGIMIGIMVLVFITILSPLNFLQSSLRDWGWIPFFCMLATGICGGSLLTKSEKAFTPQVQSDIHTYHTALERLRENSRWLLMEGMLCWLDGKNIHQIKEAVGSLLLDRALDVLAEEKKDMHSADSDQRRTRYTEAFAAIKAFDLVTDDDFGRFYREATEKFRTTSST
jgi:hypothetical protein